MKTRRRKPPAASTRRRRKPRTVKPIARAGFSPDLPYWIGLTELQLRNLIDGVVGPELRKSAIECWNPTWLRKKRR